RMGSGSYAGQEGSDNVLQTAVHVNIDGTYYGRFIIHNEYRTDVAGLFKSLQKNYKLKVLSGDNEGERLLLEQLLPPGTELVFNQKPEEKLAFIENLQRQGSSVMMVGDGLNDAGALMQSNVGIAISENTNVFSPACDAILDAAEFANLDRFIRMSKKSIQIIRMSFGLSLAYNVVGLSFAVTGNLLPIVAAIIMPLSTITIISFVTLSGNLSARLLKITTVSPKRDTRHILSSKQELILKPKTII
ncbi:HAD-IC family P-type ATPase, partial [Flavobacterium sp. BFFFF1]